MADGKLLTLLGCSTDERRKAGETSARVKLIRGRRARGETQEQFALWLGCSVDAVQLWESGKRRVPAWPLEVLSANQQRFFTSAGGTFRHAPQPAAAHACTETDGKTANSVQSWDETPQGEAHTSVAQKEAA